MSRLQRDLPLQQAVQAGGLASGSRCRRHRRWPRPARGPIRQRRPARRLEQAFRRRLQCSKVVLETPMWSMGC